MNNKQKLELTWIGKDQQPKLEPRILIEDPEKSYGDKNTDNMLIYGDNLLALKALEQDYAGKIKCIYIDPPYNTGNAFDHYDDNLEHSIWLNLMKPRLELLRNLLSEDGSIWISIDDDESHYLKVLCDEVFGRNNFVRNVIWQKRTSPDARLRLGDAHEHILVYSKNNKNLQLNKLSISERLRATYKNPDNDPRGPWVSSDYMAQGYRPNQMYEITTPGGKTYTPREGSCWANIESVFKELVADNRIWFGRNGKSVPRRKTFLSESDGSSAWSWWTNTEVGHTQEAKKEIKKLFGDNIFDTPKPERLVERIIELATNTNDLVLDSFLGSGTSAAVAHKMKRKYIGIELGDHCHTHCIPRLQKVCNGTDQGGISESVNWQGGGGFKYYYLAPSLLKKDKYNNWVIDENYNAEMLSAAMAKHNGFKYQPDETVYWKQGQSTEKDFIYTTTQMITVEHLDQIYEEMQPDEHLLICCKSFSKACESKYSNITLKKIPKMLLGKCEFGREDYSLNIVTMPVDPNEPDFVPQGAPPTKVKKKKSDDTPDLFNGDEGGEDE